MVVARPPFSFRCCCLVQDGSFWLGCPLYKRLGPSVVGSCKHGLMLMVNPMIIRLFELKITSSLQTSVSLTGSGASSFPERTNFIVLLEALAVTLAVITFVCTFAGSLLTLYIDNDGVLANFIGGSSRAPYTNKFVAVLWFECARLNIAVVFYEWSLKQM
jgi:hypothetical protein